MVDSDDSDDELQEEMTAEQCREKQRLVAQERYQRQRDRMASKINYGWQQSSANQFNQYLKQHDVLEQLRPALPFLYEMPIKPKNLYEFLGEFLDDGGQTLLKISLLQAELRFKQTQVTDLHANPDYMQWKDKLDVYLQEQAQMLQNDQPFGFGDLSGIRESVALERPLATPLPVSAAVSLKPSNDFNSIRPSKEFHVIRPSLIAETLLSAAPTPIMSPRNSIQVDLSLNAPAGLFPARTSVLVHQTPRESQADIHHGSRISIDPGYQYRPSQVPRPSLLIARNSLLPMLGFRASVVPDLYGSEFLTLEDVKAIPFQERLSIFADAEESGLSIVCTPSQAMLRIDAAYQEAEDRKNLEEAVSFIEDHKKVDPLGVLFDFNPKHCEKDFVVDLAARPSQLADETEKLRRLRKQIDPMKGTDYEEEDEDSDCSEPEYAKTKSDPAAELALLKDGFNIMAEMKQFEAEALMEQVIGTRIHSDDSSDESEANALDMAEDKDNEVVLRQYTELEGRNPNKKNRYLRVLKAPRLYTTDCVEWSGDQLKKELRQTSKLIPRMIKSLKVANAEKPIPPSPEDHQTRLLKARRIRTKEDDLLDEQKKAADAEASKYAYALKCETLHILLHLKSHLIEVLSKVKELKLKQRTKRLSHRKNFGYTKFEIDKETQRKERLQKLIGLFSHNHLENIQSQVKKDSKSTGNQKADTKTEDGHTHADHEDPGKCPHHSHKKSGRQRSRLRKNLKGFGSKATGRSSSRVGGRTTARRAKELAEAQTMNSKLKTTPDFLFEIPLDEVKATQKWINSYFPESVFRLNEPLPNPKLDEEFDDDEDENYAWMDDFYEMPRSGLPMKKFDDQLTIPRQALDRIHAYIEPQQVQDKSGDAAQRQTKAKRVCLKLINEDKFAKPKPVPSIPSLLKIPNKQLYRQKEPLRPSEKAKQYVMDTFAEPFQSEVLRSFNFSLLDPDFK